MGKYRQKKKKKKVHHHTNQFVKYVFCLVLSMPEIFYYYFYFLCFDLPDLTGDSIKSANHRAFREFIYFTFFPRKIKSVTDACFTGDPAAAHKAGQFKSTR